MNAVAPLPAYTGEILFDVPAADYHRKELGVVSASILRKLTERTPAHYRAWIDEAEESETPALAFGRAYHCRVLEPELFAATYVVAPDFGDMRSGTNRAKRDAWLVDRPGVTLLSRADADLIEAMHAALMRDPEIAELFSEGDSEVTLRWTDEATGLPCKARADRWNRRRRLMADLKTTHDASEHGFGRAVVKYGYDVTCAHYSEGAKALGEPVEKYVIVAQEKRAPYLAALYELDAAAEARGYEIRQRGMDLMASCLSSSAWPGYPRGIQPLALPGWAIANEMEISYVE